MTYSVVLSRPARKELEVLPNSVIAKMIDKIEALADEPRPRGCRKLRGENQLWRIRVGDYRIIYGVNNATRVVDIITIRHRSQAYG